MNSSISGKSRGSHLINSLFDFNERWAIPVCFGHSKSDELLYKTIVINPSELSKFSKKKKKKQTVSFPSFARKGLRAWEDGSISILNLSRKALKH